MTVAELILKLQQFDQSLTVVSAQETGYRFVEEEHIKKVHIAIDVFKGVKGGFIGPHTEDEEDFFTDYQHADVVTLSPT